MTFTDLQDNLSKARVAQNQAMAPCPHLPSKQGSPVSAGWHPQHMKAGMQRPMHRLLQSWGLHLQCGVHLTACPSERACRAVQCAVM